MVCLAVDFFHVAFLAGGEASVGEIIVLVTAIESRALHGIVELKVRTCPMTLSAEDRLLHDDALLHCLEGAVTMCSHVLGAVYYAILRLSQDKLMGNSLLIVTYKAGDLELPHLCQATFPPRAGLRAKKKGDFLRNLRPGYLPAALPFLSERKKPASNKE
jgi:hypothetical protein